MEERNERRYLLKLSPDGSMYVAKFDDLDGKDTALSALQEVVEGLIEHVPEPKEVRGRCIMYVNEEGLLRDLVYNKAASILCGVPLVGNMCIAHGDSPDTFFSLPEAEAMAMELYELIMAQFGFKGGNKDE